jgi:hypothetical protein
MVTSFPYTGVIFLKVWKEKLYRLGDFPRKNGLNAAIKLIMNLMGIREEGPSIS